MEKASVLVACAIVLIIGAGAVQAWQGCALSEQEPGGPVRCAAHVAPGALVLLGALAMAALGVLGDTPALAWVASLVALGGSILFMFSLGFFVFHALAVAVLVGVWQLTRPAMRQAVQDRRRLFRATLAAVVVFWAVSLLYFVQPFTGLYVIVAAIAAVVALATFAALMGATATPPLPPAP